MFSAAWQMAEDQQKLEHERLAKHTYNSCEALWLVFPFHTYQIDGYPSYNDEAAHPYKQQYITHGGSENKCYMWQQN